MPFDPYDPFGSLRKRMDTEEKRAGRLIEINNGRASDARHLRLHVGLEGPGSVPVRTFIPPYDGNCTIPFEATSTRRR